MDTQLTASTSVTPTNGDTVSYAPPVAAQSDAGANACVQDVGETTVAGSTLQNGDFGTLLSGLVAIRNIGDTNNLLVSNGYNFAVAVNSASDAYGVGDFGADYAVIYFSCDVRVHQDELTAMAGSASPDFIRLKQTSGPHYIGVYYDLLNNRWALYGSSTEAHVSFSDVPLVADRWYHIKGFFNGTSLVLSVDYVSATASEALITLLASAQVGSIDGPATTHREVAQVKVGNTNGSYELLATLFPNRDINDAFDSIVGALTLQQVYEQELEPHDFTIFRCSHDVDFTAIFVASSDGVVPYEYLIVPRSVYPA